MGLLDEALKEFELASAGATQRDPAGCLTMIGLCRMEKGEPGPAVAAFERALRSGDLSPEASCALRYELARACEAAGDVEGARWYVQKVLRADPRYRDAPEILARVGDGPGRPPAGHADVEPEPARRAAAQKIGYV
jgi:Tfp pilus assembly protein PilF